MAISRWQFYLRFPDFKKKAVTFSYDDGNVCDRHLVELFDKYGLKGTFNINGGLIEEDVLDDPYRRLTAQELVELFKDSPHEVACHGYTHPYLAKLPAGMAATELLEDRKVLEKMFGRVVRGFAYPFSSVNDRAEQAMEACGFAYGRTVDPTHLFRLPENFLRWDPTCHHDDPEIMELCDTFCNASSKRLNINLLFYIWGHSFECEQKNNWDHMEKVLQKVSGMDDVWYCTNGEVCDYVTAARQLISSADGSILHNPTAQTLYVEIKRDGTEQVVLHPGETVCIKTPAIV